MLLPKISNVIISNFSLYKLKEEIVLDINDGVFCLTGANGLGKSTFISILSYALTGIVVNPKKNFASINRIPEFFSVSEKFAATYFKGRIAESKRDIASVAITFSIGDMEYRVKRLFYITTGLVSFSRVDRTTGEETIDQTLSSSGLLSEYKKYFAKDVNLDSFEQFSFIHSFVLTFDESKQLIFWDESIMNRVLYMFFGVDAKDAEHADDLKKDIARHESNMRNIQWEITQSTRDLNNLSANNNAIQNDSDQIEQALNTLSELQNALQTLEEEMTLEQNEVKTVLLEINNLSLKISTLKNQYENTFNNLYSVDKIPVEKDETIISILRSITKKVIDNLDINSDIELLKERIIVISTKHQNENNAIDVLKDIDIKLSKFQDELSENYIKKNRLEKSISQNKELHLSRLENIEKFKAENDFILNRPRALAIDVSREIESLQSSINKKEIQKEKETHLRDSKKIELSSIEKKIKENYHSAEDEFIPLFKEYANSFIGLDIDIELRSTSKGIGLILKVNNTERTERFQLSESQRYFIDIALRFALIEFATKQTYILIDTPEGSLDIAYESRAGKMFADFVLKGYDVIMTANINSSQLLLQMARKCKKQKMRIERMTNWTVLSNVQQQEQEVIEEAFNNIEKTLIADD